MNRRWAFLLLAVCGCQLAQPAPDSPTAARVGKVPRAVPTSVAASQSLEPVTHPHLEPSANTRPEEDEDGAVEDEHDEHTLPDASARVTVEHPLASWSDEQIEAAVKTDLTRLGPMSFGSPSGGALLNAVHMPEGEAWELVDPAHAWGTEETVRYLVTAIERVATQFPGSHKLYIGHLSARSGGHLNPHISHQSGRDVDISFYYESTGARWYARANANNLDVRRTWALVKAFAEETDVEMILIDHSIQRLLERFARSSGEHPAYVESLFRGAAGAPPLIRHAPGHATHLHVRFWNPIALETARRAYPYLVKHQKLKPPTAYVQHKVKKGETLGMLARKYGTSVAAIQRANGLRGTKIQARKVYRIPRAGGVAAPRHNPLLIPVRRRAPNRDASAPAELLQSARN